jgi:hypothetical protein
MALSSLFASASSALTPADDPNATIKVSAMTDTLRTGLFTNFRAIFFIQVHL